MASNPSPFGGGGGTAPAVWLPSDQALLASTGDCADFSSGSGVLTAGTVYLAKLPVRSALPITNLLFSLSSAGVGASSGSFAGLYSSAGVLLSGSADIAAALTGATGVFTVPLTTPQPVSAGFFWAGFLCNLATTQPALHKTGITAAPAGMGSTPATLRWATNGTGQTVLPPTIVPAANVATAVALLVGAS